MQSLNRSFIQRAASQRRALMSGICVCFQSRSTEVFESLRARARGHETQTEHLLSMIRDKIDQEIASAKSERMTTKVAKGNITTGKASHSGLEKL